MFLCFYSFILVTVFSLQIRSLVVSSNLMIFLLGNRESSGGAVPSGKICICFCMDRGHMTVSIKSIYRGPSSVERAGLSTFGGARPLTPPPGCFPG